MEDHAHASLDNYRRRFLGEYACLCAVVERTASPSLIAAVVLFPEGHLGWHTPDSISVRGVGGGSRRERETDCANAFLGEWHHELQRVERDEGKLCSVASHVFWILTANVDNVTHVRSHPKTKLYGRAHFAHGAVSVSANCCHVVIIKFIS